MKVIRIITIVLLLVLLNGRVQSSDHNIEFINKIPAIIIIDSQYYELLEEKIDKSNVGNELGDIDNFNNVVSYIEKDNPYASIGKVYEVKGIDMEYAICIAINGDYCKAIASDNN